jgi:lysine 6-dehydrogenase
MKVLVLGGGKQGRAAAFDLLRDPEVEALGVADRDGDALEALRSRLDDDRVAVHEVDVSDVERTAELLHGYTAALNATRWQLNADVTRAAIEAQTHLVDLGGNFETVSRQVKLDTAAFNAGITVVPDCGLSPGLATFLAAHAIRQLDETNAVHIRVGILPRDPIPPLHDQLAIPVEALIDRYSERAILIRDGVKLSVEPLTEVEEIEFPQPFGTLEAFHTAGGLSTLISTFAGKVRDLDHKTIHYPGHCARMRPLRELGFFNRELLRIGAEEMERREITARLLAEALRGDAADVVLLRVTVVGAKFGGRQRLEYELIDAADATTGMSAVMRCTAWPACVVVRMLAEGRIDRRGVVPLERCPLPVDDFIVGLRQRGLDIVLRRS